MDEAARNGSSPRNAADSAGRPAHDEAQEFPDDDGPLYCRVCGYPVNKLGRPTCPECGTDFDPDDPFSVETSPPGIIRPMVERAMGWLERGIAIIIVVGLAIAFVAVIVMVISEIVDG